MKRLGPYPMPTPEEERWLPLATYNAEVARGIVHTPEYDAKMAAEQAEFNDECKEFGCHEPDHSSRYERPDA